MSHDPQLESYLSALDRALGAIPASSRAEIILEIKSHVLDAREQEPTRSTASIIASLGEPEAVANRYLMERGLKPGRPPRGAVAKWLTIGFLGTVAMILVTIGTVAYNFFPIVSVDEDKGSVKILGGMINVHGDLSDGDHDFDLAAEAETQAIDRTRTDLLQIDSRNHKLTVGPSPDARLHWGCKGRKNAQGTQEGAREDGRKLILTLNDARFGRCEVQVPAGLGIRVDGANGKLTLLKPQGDLDVTLANGKVVLQPDPAKEYVYDLHAANGTVDHFESSTAPAAVRIKVSVANGKIVHDRS